MEKSDIEEKTGLYPVEISLWLEDVLAGRVIKSIGNLNTNGVGLLFDGPPGLGKTTQAVVAAMEVLRYLPDDDDSLKTLFKINSKDFGVNFRPLYYLTYPEFLALKKSSFDLESSDKETAMYELDGFHGRSKADWMNVRILIIDDLGKEYGSKYDDASFDEILRIRYDRSLPTIITTNVKLEDWEDKYSDAMASFAKEAFNRVPVTGKDLRGA